VAQKRQQQEGPGELHRPVREIFELSLKRFFLYSSVVHALVITALIFLVHPAKEKKTGGEFYTSLVSPEEILPPRPVTPPPVMRSTPGRRSTPSPPPSRMRPVPSRPPAQALPKTAGPSPPAGGEGNVPPEEGAPSPRPPSASSVPGSGGVPGNTGEAQEQPGKAPSLRERLFDKNIIANLTRRDIEREEEKEKKNKDFTFNAKEYRFLLYNTRLKERIESIWVYPPYEAEHGIYGDLEIRFTIKKNGQLGSVEILRTSGHKSLDDAAIKALRDGAPYWPLPDDWGMEAYTIEGHFIYTIYGYYLR
jgi:protein TonB